MYASLARGTKVSVTSSIKTCFSLYMAGIEWDDEKYDSNDFVKKWLDYSKENAAWYGQIAPEIMADEVFLEQLIAKVNETIKGIIETEPSPEQMEEVDRLVKLLKIDDVDYCCKAEADFQIDRLKDMLS